MERRGYVRQSINIQLKQKQEEILIKTKQFNIPKELFVQAFRLVKANQGAAGIDLQLLEDFEKNLQRRMVASAF